METESLILGILIVALSALIVLWPFINPAGRRNGAAATSSEMETLVTQRDAIYATIRDLDFDYETGKLEEADYRAERAIWVERGVDALKAIDLLQQQTGEVPPDDMDRGQADLDQHQDIDSGDFDAQIEAAIASRRRTV